MVKENDMAATTCVKCEVGYQIVKSGVYLVTMFNNPPEPYQIWHADMHQCPECGEKIVTGRGSGAISEHFKVGFSDYLQQLESDKQTTVIKEYENTRW